MPNWIQGKKSLFPIKYPSVPRKVPKQRGSKTKAPKLQTNIPNPTTDELGPGKRTRRLPKRYVRTGFVTVLRLNKLLSHRKMRLN